MSKVIKPVIVIVLAVGVAAGAAVLLSRQAEEPAADTTAASAPSSGPPAYVASGGGQFRGPATAKVTLVEFGDYQCPSCKAYHPLVQALLERYPQQLRLEFHHYPLISIHPHAMQAATAVEAAGEQGRYWEMHDLIFENQDQWSRKPNPEADFLTYASRIGLNQNAFMQAMRSPAIQDRILKDVVRAREARIEGVPTFFIDGQMIDNKYSVDYYAQIIDEYLQKK
jgi:protein-disulfide isomerase